MNHPYELHAASLCANGTTVFADLDLRIRDRCVTMLMGPAGTGKSTFLETLAGVPPVGSVRLGRWDRRGSPLVGASERVWYLPQRSPWEALAVDTQANIHLLDEPSVGLREDQARELRALLARWASSGAVVVITHDLSFAREVGEDLLFLCAGAVRFAGAVSTFFASPPDDLAARFVKQGNCWPAAPRPELPSHFRWVLESSLGGMGRPGLLRDEEEDLTAMAQASLGWVVSLTEEPFPAARLRAFGLQARHFPVPDMGVPAVGPTAALCSEIARWIASGERVVVHCHAGLGRTGTILAAVLVWLGRTSEEAVCEVRAQNSRFIQTAAQLDFVRRFAETCGGGPNR